MVGTMTKIDDSVKKKVPELRFKGFTDDWKQCKFSNLAEVRRGLTYKPSDVQQYGIRVLRSSNIAEDTFLIKSDDVFVNKEAVKIDKVKNGDILITAANGSNRLVGKHALIEGIENDTVHGGFMLVARAEKPEFVNAIMSSSWYSKFINIFVSGGNGAIGNLSKSDLENQKVYVPSEIEQQKIGSFFKQLDDTIALHQRKLDLLKEQKKGFLQKMFPKNGAKVPELRFAGFADDWEERKLGDISYKVKEKNKTGEFTETLTNSAEYGIINQRDFFNKDISNAKNLTGYYVVKNDDFVYNPRISNFAPVGPIKRNKLGRTGVMSPLYYVFRTHDIDKNYLEKYFDTVYWHRFMKLNGDSGVRADRFAIKESVFVEMPIPYPTIEEQEKIGSFFKQLDDTIALHQRKLDLLKEQKKGFLQKMFV
jgi:type I restriction enzyme S subunit